MGIWPLKNYIPIFLFFFIYLSIHCSLAIAELFWAPKTLENVVSNIAENIASTMTLTKITITRMNREALRKLFTELEEFSLTEKYETKEEKLTFVNYTKLPPYFIIVITSSMTVAELLYYMNRVTEGIQIAFKFISNHISHYGMNIFMKGDLKIYRRNDKVAIDLKRIKKKIISNSKQNNSMGYKLPYRTLEIMDLRDSRIYALICAYQLILVPAIILGYVGFDCMFVNLSIQVITQFSMLSYKVKSIINNSKNYRDGMKKLILRHYRLIRLTETLEDNFNLTIMQQLFGTTIHICLSGYYVLMQASFAVFADQVRPHSCKNYLLAWQTDKQADQFPYLTISKETKDNLQSFLFFVYISSVICTLFIYCFIGECFIQESSNYGNAIYNYDWYNLPVTESKFFLICMTRTKKPQFLTSGKFAVLSLSMFTDILKTSIGYLSVLRTFV
ncbi:uncharacterized protein LOC124432465 [Vespa crabro]|uniref:uncharacterized protein LOC124432465 n=1 Tax=Vespa crabro TaxID=7445 RepID=UPI001F02A255|nr:uncharacterized protein LOC124432465 [Vespa crabro]